MREYKFRGMAHDDWYYGDLVIAYDKDKNKHYYIITEDYESKDTNIELNTCASPEVEADRVGQYTGLHDKNGKEMYEGDIVKVKHNNCIYIGKVKCDEEHCEYRIELVDAYIKLWKKLDIEVIGNIYENKELLEG